MAFLMKSMKNRQVGANEAANRLFCHKLHSKSWQLRLTDLVPVDRAKLVIKPAKELETIAPKNSDSCKIYQPHWVFDVFDVYPDRPHEIESLSLYEFLG